MERQFPDFTDSLNWNLVSRSSLNVQWIDSSTYHPLPKRSFALSSFVVSVGVKSAKAMPHWYLGGWASMFIPMLPSSTSEFTAVQNSFKRSLRLGVLNLLILPKIAAPYILELSFPKWLEDVTFEVWSYDGRDVDAFTRFDQVQTDLQRIEQKIDFSD